MTAVAMELLLVGLAIVEGLVAINSSVTCHTIGVDLEGSYCCPTDPQYYQVIKQTTRHHPFKEMGNF